MNPIIPAQNKRQSAIQPSASVCGSKLSDTLHTGLPPQTATFSAVHFSSNTDEWPTPKWLFQALDREFRFTLDPCSTDQNAKCAKHFTRKENGLIQPWHDEAVFMNPPYGREIAEWMEKAYSESKQGALVVCLIPSRTDTVWWHKFAMRGEIRFWPGRLKFEGAKASAPFPSAIVIFRPKTFMLGSMTGIEYTDEIAV
ncbi:MAG: hypothetical protein H0U23_01665 [Blastocatellia bacterium]|nr:hypothetical protein [Blastocatellia bacterium]